MLVTLYKREGAKAPYYYSLDDRQQNLFNPYTLTVSWGRHPEGGCKKQYVFASQSEKSDFVRRLLAQKLRSYKVLYSYFKERQGERGDDGRGLAGEAGLFRQA